MLRLTVPPGYCQPDPRANSTRLPNNRLRYWGYTALTAAIGRQDGFKLAITGRGNPGTDKGSAEAFLSYPLRGLWDGLPHVYVFGQAFTGYGEALSDYKRSATHARLGIAFTR